VQQLVQATALNGSTIYVPANQHYQTVIVNQMPHGSSQGGGAHQIVLHHQGAQSGSVTSSAQPMVGAQHVYVHTSAPGTASGTTSLVNGMTPGTGYAAHPAPGPMHGTASAQSQHPQVVHVQAGAHGQAGASTSAQQAIDPGRTVVQAPHRPPEPVFLPPPNSVQVRRAMHSETYLRYIESLSSAKQRSVSKWDKSLTANPKNTLTNSKRTAGPYEWIRDVANGIKPREDEVVKALWTLRDHMLESTMGIARDSEVRF
jgi:hypothetical protein